MTYGGGSYCSEECAYYQFHPENYVKICRSCGLAKGEKDISHPCKCFYTLSRIVLFEEWKKTQDAAEDILAAHARARKGRKKMKARYEIDSDELIEAVTLWFAENQSIEFEADHVTLWLKSEGEEPESLEKLTVVVVVNDKE